MLARESDHWPNFWDVFVNVMFGVIVLLMIAYKHKVLCKHHVWGDSAVDDSVADDNAIDDSAVDDSVVDDNAVDGSVVDECC